jgi:DNA polymerase III epsilon subunit-like protein
MINCFFDTEFTGFELITQEIISLGIVSEDGNHEFYVENTSHHESFRSDFVQKIVVPILDNEKYGHPYKQCCGLLTVFLEHLPDTHINFIYDYTGDVDLVVPMIEAMPFNSLLTKRITFELFQHALVRTLQERGVHTESKIDNAVRTLFDASDTYYLQDPRQHHALVDAKANRHAFLRAIKAGME